MCYVADFVADMQRREQRRENRTQMAIAAFASTHSKDWSPEQFLPWSVNEKAVTGSTLEILRKLVDDGALNTRA
ncbi:MAG: hypothetical protein AAF959_22665, partial [Cyanobacteria bacterium P01_D01_bin.56]